MDDEKVKKPGKEREKRITRHSKGCAGSNVQSPSTAVAPCGVPVEPPSAPLKIK